MIDKYIKVDNCSVNTLEFLTGDSFSDDAKVNMKINLKKRITDDELMDAASTPPKIVIGRKLKPKPVKRLQHPSSRLPSSLLSHASSKTLGKNALLIQSA